MKSSNHVVRPLTILGLLHKQSCSACVAYSTSLSLLAQQFLWVGFHHLLFWVIIRSIRLFQMIHRYLLDSHSFQITLLQCLAVGCLHATRHSLELRPLQWKCSCQTASRPQAMCNIAKSKCLQLPHTKEIWQTFEIKSHLRSFRHDSLQIFFTIEILEKVACHGLVMAAMYQGKYI